MAAPGTGTAFRVVSERVSVTIILKGRQCSLEDVFHILSSIRERLCTPQTSCKLDYTMLGAFASRVSVARGCATGA